MTPLYLGIDGGGTKTAMALVSADGALVARQMFGGSYFAGEPGGIDALRQILADGVGSLLDTAGRPTVTAAFLGIPGFGDAIARLGRR